MKRLLVAVMIALSASLPVRPAHGARANLVVEVNPMVKDLEGRQGEDFEAMFLAFMIHHAWFGIRIAALAEDRAADAALKRLAATAIDTQQREIGQLDQWLEQWHPRKPGDDQIPQATQEKELKILGELEKNKDAKFDELFSARLRAHQDTTVQLARLASDRAIHEEVKVFARQLVEQKAKEKQ